MNNTLLQEATKFFAAKYKIKELTEQMSEKLKNLISRLFEEHQKQKPDMFLSINSNSFNPLCDEPGEDLFKRIHSELSSQNAVMVVNFEAQTIWVSEKQNAAKLIYRPAA